MTGVADVAGVAAARTSRYAADNGIGSRIEGSSFSGLLTRIVAILNDKYPVLFLPDLR
jgi:hypothetical protein